MTSDGLARRADAVVVGGGCMGASIVFHLARRGVDAVLVERGHIGSGATGHSGALVRQHYESRVGIRLARDSLAFFRRFEAETGYPCDFRTTGFLSGAREGDLAAFDALVSLLKSERIRAEPIAPKEAKQMEPRLEVSDYAAVVHDPDAGYADPIATAVGFARGAERAGARILERREARDVLVRKGRASGVKVGGGTITAPRVLLASGNWTKDLAARLEVSLPIRFVKGQVAILRRPPDFGAAPRIHFDFYAKTYSRPEAEKDTLVGYMETDPRKAVRRHELSDDSVSMETVRELRNRLAKRFPAMAQAQPRGGWAGVYDVTPDSYPIVDGIGPDGLFVAAGFSGHGFKLAPEVGRLVAEYVATDRRPEGLHPLRASRFDERDPVVPDAPFPARRGPRLP